MSAAGRNEEVDNALKVSKVYWEKSCNLEKDHCKTAKIVYGLETKDKFFLNLITNIAVKSILKQFINDPYFGVLPEEIPNYHIGYYVARSTDDALLTHIDSYIPHTGNFPTIMQCLFALEKQTLKNGCTYVVPESHLYGKYPDQKIEYESSNNILSNPGDLIIWDARIWHGTRKNNTNDTRWALVVTFMRFWIKARLDATRNITKEYYSSLNDEQKALLGFCSIPPHDLKKRVIPRMSIDQLYKDPRNFYYHIEKKK